MILERFDHPLRFTVLTSDPDGDEGMFFGSGVEAWKYAAESFLV